MQADTSTPLGAGHHMLAAAQSGDFKISLNTYLLATIITLMCCYSLSLNENSQ